VNADKGIGLYYSAAIATGISGVLQLRLFLGGSNRGINEIGVFFLVSVVLQVFWVMAMMRRSGKTWSYAGLGGTTVLIIIWL
jgi:hypothetical protein